MSIERLSKGVAALLAVTACSPRITINPSQQELCAGLPDVRQDDPDCEAIAYVVSNGFLERKPDGKFGKDLQVPRDELARALLKAAGLFEERVDYCQGRDPFPDVRLAECEIISLCQAICAAQLKGILRGHGKDSPYAGQVRPKDGTNNGEFATILYRIAGEPNIPPTEPWTDVTSDSKAWYKKPSEYARHRNLLEGPEFRWDKKVDRGTTARAVLKGFGPKSPKRPRPKN